jgi:hypothetical protein
MKTLGEASCLPQPSDPHPRRIISMTEVQAGVKSSLEVKV